MVRTKAACQRQRLLLREGMTKQTSYQDPSGVHLVIYVAWLGLVGFRERNKLVEILWSGCDPACFRRRLIGKGLTKSFWLGQKPKLQSSDEISGFSVLLFGFAQWAGKG
jgi:hypothetical protein